MVLDERARELVYEALEPVIGAEAAQVLSRELPDAQVATKAHLDTFSTEVNRRFEEIDQRFAEIDRRFEQVDRRFEQVDHRFEQVDHRFELVAAEIRELRSELLAAFRGELVAAVSGQSRTMLLGMLGTAVTIALAALAFAQVLS